MDRRPRRRHNRQIEFKIEICAAGDYRGQSVVLRARVPFATQRLRGARDSDLTAGSFGRARGGRKRDCLIGVR